MSGRGIDDTGKTFDRYRVDKHPGFESLEDCQAEDASRERRLLRSLRRGVIDPALAMPLILNLQEAQAEGVPAESLASSVYMRQLRINVCGNIWEMLDNIEEDYLNEYARTFTIVPKSWEFKAGELASVDPNALLNPLRTALYEQGAAESWGWMIAIIHGEFDPIAKVYRLHVHGLALGGMVQAIDRLRTLPNYQTRPKDAEGRPSPVYQRVVVNRKPLTDVPQPITYLVQSFWPSRAVIISDDGTRIRQRNKGRISEPYHSEVLLWLNRWRLTDLTLMIGLRVTINGLRQTNKVS